MTTGPNNEPRRPWPAENPGASGPSRSGRPGFTLLELVLVLVLISIALAMAAPSLRGFADVRRTADAASQLLAMTHWARSHAAALGDVCRLNIDTQECTYWLTVRQAGTFVELEGEYGRCFRLPDGVTVRLDTPLADAEAEYVQFYPNGRCDEAVIELVGRQGEVFRVTCDSCTERFRIASNEEMQDS